MPSMVVVIEAIVVAVGALKVSVSFAVLPTSTLPKLAGLAGSSDCAARRALRAKMQSAKTQAREPIRNAALKPEQIEASNPNLGENGRIQRPSRTTRATGTSG